MNETDLLIELELEFTQFAADVVDEEAVYPERYNYGEAEAMIDAYKRCANAVKKKLGR